MKLIGTFTSPIYPIPHEYQVENILLDTLTEPFYCSQLSEDGKFINFYLSWATKDIEPEFAFKFPISYLDTMKRMRG